MDDEISRYKCTICRERSRFILEWYGVNQYGENPEVAAEEGARSDFNHIMEIMKDERYYPYSESVDGILDPETLDVEHPELTDIVNKAFHAFQEDDLRDYHRLCKQGQKLISGEQQLFLFDKRKGTRQLFLFS